MFRNRKLISESIRCLFEKLNQQINDRTEIRFISFCIRLRPKNGAVINIKKSMLFCFTEIVQNVCRDNIIELS